MRNQCFHGIYLELGYCSRNILDINTVVIGTREAEGVVFESEFAVIFIMKMIKSTKFAVFLISLIYVLFRKYYNQISFNIDNIIRVA